MAKNGVKSGSHLKRAIFFLKKVLNHHFWAYFTFSLFLSSDSERILPKFLFGNFEWSKWLKMV